MGEKRLQKITNNDVVPLKPMPDPEENPPSFQEAMAEKKKLLEAQDQTTSPAGREEEIYITEEEVRVLTAKERLIKSLNKIIHVFRLVTQWSTIVSNIVLWFCCFGILIVGCLVLTEKIAITWAVYQRQFRDIASTMIGLSSLNLVIFCPMAILGSLLKKKLPLQYHNIWLSFTIIALGIFFFVLYYSQNPEEKLKDRCEKQRKSLYKYCFVKRSGPPDQCCCVRKENATLPVCWQYDENVALREELENDGEAYKLRCREGVQLYEMLKKAYSQGLFYLSIYIIVQIVTVFFGCLATSTIPKYPDDLNGILDEPEGRLGNVRSEPKAPKKRTSVFKRAFIFFVVKRAFLFLWFFLFSMGVYGIKAVTENVIAYKVCALGFAIVQIQVLGSEQSDLAIRRNRREYPKGKARRAFYKAKRLACRRLLIVIFSFLFVIGYFFYRLWSRDFSVEVKVQDKPMNVNVIDVFWFILEEDGKVLNNDAD